MVEIRRAPVSQNKVRHHHLEMILKAETLQIVHLEMKEVHRRIQTVLTEIMLNRTEVMPNRTGTMPNLVLALGAVQEEARQTNPADKVG